MFTATHIVSKNVANLYEKPSSNSPLDTQALLNQIVELQSEESGFCRVVGSDDFYGGWIDQRWLATVKNLPSTETAVVKDLFADVLNEPKSSSDILTKIVLGTKVNLAVGATPCVAREDNSYMKILLPGGQTGYVNKSALQLGAIQINSNNSAAIASKAVQVAKQMIGVPYLWGGTTPFGLDCSGLVQLCYKMSGMQLKRNADMQATDKRFSKVEEGKKLGQGDYQIGDLLSFGKDGNITHIGLALGDGKFIHASGSNRRAGVFIDSCQDSIYADIFTHACRLTKIAGIDAG